LDNLVFGDLTIQVDETTSPEGPIVLSWVGKSQDRQPGKALDPFLGGVVQRAEETGRAVEMRFEKLTYFNSSTLTAIIGLVQQTRRRSVRLAIVFDRKLKWQKLSFDAIRVLGKGDGLLEIHGE
jgi:hypothetical protein